MKRLSVYQNKGHVHVKYYFGINKQYTLLHPYKQHQPEPCTTCRFILNFVAPKFYVLCHRLKFSDTRYYIYPDWHKGSTEVNAALAQGVGWGRGVGYPCGRQQMN